MVKQPEQGGQLTYEGNTDQDMRGHAGSILCMVSLLFFMVSIIMMLTLPPLLWNLHYDSLRVWYHVGIMEKIKVFFHFNSDTNPQRSKDTHPPPR